jgi:spore maturation protein CgeB
MEEHFTNHKNIVWFKTVEDGIDLVRYYLEHDYEREAIAHECYKLACEKFTFEQRMHDFEKVTRVLL